METKNIKIKRDIDDLVKEKALLVQLSKLTTKAKQSMHCF